MKKFIKKEIITRIKTCNKSKKAIKLDGYYDAYIQTSPKYMRPEFIDIKFTETINYLDYHYLLNISK